MTNGIRILLLVIHHSVTSDSVKMFLSPFRISYRCIKILRTSTLETCTWGWETTGTVQCAACRDPSLTWWRECLMTTTGHSGTVIEYLWYIHNNHIYTQFNLTVFQLQTGQQMFFIFNRISAGFNWDRSSSSPMRSQRKIGHFLFVIRKGMWEFLDHSLDSSVPLSVVRWISYKQECKQRGERTFWIWKER